MSENRVSLTHFYTITSFIRRVGKYNSECTITLPLFCPKSRRGLHAKARAYNVHAASQFWPSICIHPAAWIQDARSKLREKQSSPGTSTKVAQPCLASNHQGHRKRGLRDSNCDVSSLADLKHQSEVVCLPSRRRGSSLFMPCSHGASRSLPL